MVNTATESLGTAGASPTRAPIRVSMHVLGTAATDPRVLREATALVEAGYAVSIVDIEGKAGPITQPTNAASAPRSIGDLALRAQVGRKEDHQSEEMLRGVLLKHVMVSRSFFSTRFDRWTLLRVGSIFLRTTLRLLRTPTDVYHGHEVSGLLPCAIAAFLRRKPVIFDAHEMPLFERPVSELGRSRRMLRKLLSALLAYIVPRCVGVITVSPPIVEELRKRYGLADVALIRNVPPYRAVAKGNLLRERLGLAPEVRVVLYQGYLQPNRGLDRLIRAASLLEPNTVIVMMGKNRGTTQERLEALIASEGVADRVKILPPVPYEELLDWTASADIGVNVASPDYSLNVRYFLPNKLFEYLMAGLPVLTSPLEAMVNVVNTYDAGQVLPSLEPAAIAAAINRMLADPAALARMSRNALEATRNDFNWEIEREKLLKLYQDLFEKEAPPPA